MTSRYNRKLTEIGKARNGSKTASKVRGIKWTAKQMKWMRVVAASEQQPSIETIKTLYPSLGDYKSNFMLNKIKQMRKQMADLIIGDNVIDGVRNSKGKGIVYLVENEIYPGWIKCGMTTNINKRLNSYNCNDPLKRFRVILEKEVDDRRKSETFLKRELGIISSLANGEWFRIDRETALKIFNSVK